MRQNADPDQAGADPGETRVDPELTFMGAPDQPAADPNQPGTGSTRTAGETPIALANDVVTPYAWEPNET